MDSRDSHNADITNLADLAEVAEVVVVTGVGGIALASARRLASGRRLVLASRTESRLTQAAQTLRCEGHDVHERLTDVSDPGDVRALAEYAASLGRLRTVVHTAGVSPLQATVDQIISIDVLGTAHMLDAFLDHVVTGTVMVCVSSSSGAMITLPPDVERALATTPTSELAGLPVFTSTPLDSGMTYAIAKRANQLRVRASSIPYGRGGARVVSVSPGLICTRMGHAELEGPSGARTRSLISLSGMGRSAPPTISPPLWSFSPARLPATSPARTC